MKICYSVKMSSGKAPVLVYFGMCGFVAVSAIIFAVQGEWMSSVSAVLIFLLMLVPTLLKEQYRIYLPFELDLAIVTFIFFSLFLGSLQNYYERFPFWDGVLHFQSGLLLGVVGFVLVYLMNVKKNAKFNLRPGFVALFTVCFALSLSVVWEVYEFAMDSLFGYTMQESGLPDTMGDLIVNGVGAIIVGILGYMWMKHRERLPFAPKKFKKYILS